MTCQAKHAHTYAWHLCIGAPTSKRSSPHCRWCTSHASGSRRCCCRPRPVCHLWTWLCSSCSCEVHALAASALFQDATCPLRIAVAMRTWQHGGMGCKRGIGHLNVVCPMNRDLPGARYHQPARHQRAAVPLLGGTDTMQFLGSVRMLGYAMKVATHTGTLQPFLNTTRFTSVYAARQRLVSSASCGPGGTPSCCPGTRHQRNRHR